MKKRIEIFILGCIIAQALSAQVSPEQAARYNQLGQQYQQQREENRDSAAIKTLEEMCRIIPDKAELYAMRADLWSWDNIGNLDSAVANWTRAIAINDSVPYYYFRRAKDTWMYQGKANHYKSSLDDHKAISIDSFYFPAYDKLQVYYYNNDTQQASRYRKLTLKKMQQAAALYPDSAIFWYYLGEAWNKYLHGLSSHKIGFDTCLTFYSKAISLDTTQARYYFARGCINCNALGNYNACLPDMQHALKIYDWIVYRHYIIICFNKLGRYKEALAATEEALLKYPDDEYLQKNKKELLLKTGGGK